MARVVPDIIALDFQQPHFLHQPWDHPLTCARSYRLLLILHPYTSWQTRRRGRRVSFSVCFQSFAVTIIFFFLQRNLSNFCLQFLEWELDPVSTTKKLLLSALKLWANAPIIIRPTWRQGDFVKYTMPTVMATCTNWCRYTASCLVAHV